MAARITLIHWNEEEGLGREAQLHDAGFDARLLPPASPPNVRAIRDDLPDAVVIDLTRLPSHGREVAVVLRQWRTTRHLPLIFAGGPPDKVALIRERLPDATYAEWERIKPALKQALRARTENPVVPPRLEGYTASSLPKKLGIKAGRGVLLLNAPDGFEERLQPLEDGPLHTILLFAKSQEVFEARVVKAVSRLPETGALWIVYPKKSSALRTDLTQNGIREYCLALGLVDYKICAVDETWTALCFARRRTSRS
jgi:hypothetical protein